MTETNTLYPNLLEEIRQNDVMFEYCAIAANITGKLLNAALENGEKLQRLELLSMAQTLKCDVEYLESKELRTFGKTKADKKSLAEFKETTNKLVELRDFAIEIGAKPRYWTDRNFMEVLLFWKELREQKSTSYAHYRKVVSAAKYVKISLNEEIREARRTKPRDLAIGA